jgi:hypothetical protein
MTESGRNPPSYPLFTARGSHWDLGRQHGARAAGLWRLDDRWRKLGAMMALVGRD